MHSERYLSAVLVVVAGATLPSGGLGSGSAQVAGVSAAGGVPAQLQGAVSVGGVPYTRVDLGSLGGGQSWAYDLNERGQVVGDSFPPRGRHAFLWDPVSGMRDLGKLRPGSVTQNGARAVALNERGQVVGWSGGRAFLWDPGVGMTDLGTLGGTYAEPIAVNERGQVAGKSTTASGTWHAFHWDPVAGMRDLGETSAVALNDFGQVAGTAGGRASLWDPVAGMTDVGTLGGLRSAARALNNRGQVAGWSETSSGQLHAFLWDPESGMQDLGDLGPSASTEPMPLNERGQVAGTLHLAGSDDRRHAFLWDPESGMQDLGSLGGDSYATAINERGQVLGRSWTSNPGRWHEFLWDPMTGMTDLGYSPDGGAVALNDRGQAAGGKFLWTPSSLAPHVRVKVSRAGSGDKLRVNVNPNRIGETWMFRVQAKVAGVWKTRPQRYQTSGTADTRRLTLGPGRYRVKVPGQYGYSGAISEVVRLTAKTATPARPYCGIWWGSLPKQARGGPVVDPITNVRAGRHACFDRLVVDLAGPQPAYRVRYAQSVRSASGESVPLRGGAALRIKVWAPTHDSDSQAGYQPRRPRNIVPVDGYRTFRQARLVDSLTQASIFGLGVRARLPFRVLQLHGPGQGSRLVIDVAHRW